MSDSVGQVAVDIVVANTKGLFKSISKIGEKIKDNFSKSLSKNFLASAANIKAAFDMATGSVRTLTSSFKGLMSDYQTQIESEARLGATMRNTTGATKEQIQSIKDLAGEIQGLGVVGDEVSLAGMQELATYVENVDSLKTMMPVLDDMIAQQYGFSASTDSAVTISTMLGKVLQGQTSALSRYGYSFTKAQENLLKYGTEEQRVATLASVVSESVGGVNKALADTPTGKMKQLSNDFGDLKETLGGLVTNVLYPIVKYLDVIVVKLNNVFSVLNENIKNMFGITDDVSSGSGIVNLSDSAYDASDAVDGTTDSVKALKKAVAGFDQLNILSESNDTATDTSAAATSVTPALDISNADSAVNSFIDKMNSRLAKIFEPIKTSWDKYGKSVISAWQGALKSIKQLLSDIGNSFEKAWQSDSAKNMLDTILKLLGNIGRTIDSIATALDKAWNDNGNGEKLILSYINRLNAVLSIINTVGENFRKAWESGDTGEHIFANIIQSITNINNGLANLGNNLDEALKSPSGQQAMEKLLDIIESITSHAKTLTEDFESWSKDVDFQPLIDSFNNLLTPIKDIVDNCLDGMEEFNKSVVLPTSKWVIEEAVPAAFNAIAEALKLINETAQPVSDTLSVLFTSILDPIGKWLGSGIIKAIDEIGETLNETGGKLLDLFSALQPFVDWLIDCLQPAVMGVMTVISGAVSGAWEIIVSIVNGILDILTGAIDFLTGVFTGDWKKAWNGIGKIFTGVFSTLYGVVEGIAKAIAGLFMGVFDVILSAAKIAFGAIAAVFKGAWNVVSTVWNKAGNFFSNVWNGIKSAFGTAKEWLVSQFTGAWNNITGLFNKGGQIFIGMRDAIGDVFKNAVNNLIDGINWVISQPFNGINDALQGIKDVEILGAKPFDWLPTIDTPTIPHLAKGGLVTAPTLALVGDNKGASHDPEVVSPLSKLQGMINSDPEVVPLLRRIVTLLENEEDTFQNIIYLDSEVIERKLVKVRKRKQRRYGGAT